VSRRRLGAELAAVALVAIAWAVGLHWPMVSELGSVIPGEAGSDAFRAHWSVWLMGAEFPSWPFETTRVNFPQGVEWLPFPAVSLWLAAPMSAALGVDLALPLMIMAHTALAVVGGWALVRVLGGGVGGGLVAGAVIATQPILGGALRDGTLEVLTAGWMPLCLASMILACRGGRRAWAWGVLTGLLYLAICMESVYHGSFMALAVLAALVTLRTRAGVLGAGLAGVTVAVGAWGLYGLFHGVIENIPAMMTGAGDDLAALRVGNAASLKGLKAMARSPGSGGWIVGAMYAPPMAWWIAFAVGAALSLRKSWWLALLAVAYTLLAVGHDAVGLWDHSPIGEVVRFPRRYMAPAGVMIGACAGLGLAPLRRWRWVEPVAGVGLMLYLGLWGAHAGGFVSAYPLVELPEVHFADALARDSEDFAVLMVPLEIPGAPSGHRDEAPVFAEIHRDIASSDHLYLQTRLGKRAWYAPSLLTMDKRLPHSSAKLAKNLNDLAFGSTDNLIPASAQLEAKDYASEVAWLMGQGFKYIALDSARYTAEARPWLDDLRDSYAVEVTEYDDGTGVVVYQLYNERPPPTDTPASVVGQGASQTVSAYTGNVALTPEERPKSPTVVVRLGDKETRCPVKASDGNFICEGVSGMSDVWVELEGQRFEVNWSAGKMTGATLELER